MSASHKVATIRPPSISPDLKSFLDEVLVPMLVRDALKEIAAENSLASASMPVAHSRPSALSQRREVTG